MTYRAGWPKIGTVARGSVLAGLMVLMVWAVAWGDGPPQYDAMGKLIRMEPLTDYSQGTLGVLGPFYWTRATNLSEEARFSDALGRPDRQGTFLWCFGAGVAAKHAPTPVAHPLHPRNNFQARDPGVAYRLQVWQTLLNRLGAHNAKISIAYAQKDYLFQNGDNEDIAHLMGADRVALFMPIRTTRDADPYDPAAPYVSPEYAAQSFCVIEFMQDEMIAYEWFRQPRQLHERILFDLAPHFSGEKLIRPGVTKPLVQFDIHEGGGWTLKIEPDGRDGLKGGKNPEDWDYVFTHQSPGARPYSARITPADSRWALTVYTPNGSPIDSSEIMVGLQPYDRATGKEAPWVDRHIRIRDVPIPKVEAEIERIRKLSAGWRARLDDSSETTP